MTAFLGKLTMNTLDYIFNRFNLADPPRRMPWEIREFGRDDLAQVFGELGFGRGAEIGVERGLYTEILCRTNPEAMIYAIDPWTPYKGYRDHVSQRKLNGFYQETLERVKSYNCTIIKMFSEAAALSFEDESLDFVYIDANHEFVHVVADLGYWVKKVKPGGIVAGHDFKRDKKPGNLFHVKPALYGYTDAYEIKPWFILKKDRAASWFWVKDK